MVRIALVVTLFAFPGGRAAARALRARLFFSVRGRISQRRATPRFACFLP
jgi:hypothetical protein